MSDTITVEGDTDNHQESTQNRSANGIAVDDAVDPRQADTDAIREAQAALERTTTQLAASRKAEADARKLAADARTDASRARDEAARLQQNRGADQRSVLAQTVATAEAELSAARLAVKSAGEMGDWEALTAAQEAIAAATYRKSHATAQLAGLGDPKDDEPRQQPTEQRQQQAPVWVPSERDRAWLAAHPRMETDPDYAATAAFLDQQARRRGLLPNTDGYYAHLDRGMAAAYPDEASQSNGERAMNGGERQQQSPPANTRTSTAGASNRGGGGSQSAGFKVVNTGLGPLEVSDTSAGMRIRMPQGAVRENMEEGAQVCFPDQWMKDPAAALATYMGEQVKIAREQEAGGTAGLIVGEGRTFR